MLINLATFFGDRFWINFGSFWSAFLHHLGIHFPDLLRCKIDAKLMFESMKFKQMFKLRGMSMFSGSGAGKRAYSVLRGVVQSVSSNEGGRSGGR